MTPELRSRQHGWRRQRPSGGLVWPGRALDVCAVAAHTIRETSRVDVELRLGQLRAVLARLREYEPYVGDEPPPAAPMRKVLRMP